MSTEQVQKKLDPDTNVYHISNKYSPNGTIFTAKIFLQKYEQVELHGLGDATRLVAIAAEDLRRNGYVKIKQIVTETFQSEQSDRRGNKKVKLIVKLDRIDDAKERITQELQQKQQKRNQDS